MIHELLKRINKPLEEIKADDLAGFSLDEKRAIVNEIKTRKELVIGLPHLYGYKHYAWSRQIFEETEKKMIFLCAANQVGKALDDDTMIPSPNGFIRIGDIKIGDIIFGRDGNITKVTHIPFKSKTDGYKITFDDGSSVICSDYHEWVCKTSEERFRKQYKSNFKRSKNIGAIFKNDNYDKWINLDAVDIFKKGQYYKNNRPYDRCSIPVCFPLNYSEKKLFDPYLIGLIIGDGCISGNSVVLSTSDNEIFSYINGKYTVKPTGKYGYRINGINQNIRDIGLMGHRSIDKFIPNDYLEGSIGQRINLLKGLMDTDGTIYGKCTMSYSTISDRLKNDFIQLVTSLGGKCRPKKKKAGYKKYGVYTRCNDVWEIKINIDFCPFSLKRKSDKYYKISRRHERIIYSMEKVFGIDMTCITVDNSDGTFLCTKDHIVTHNSSSAIRKCIEMAGNPDVWHKYWKTRPIQFWYLYPSKELATVEFKKKWVKEFLPRFKFKDHPTYGWTAHYDKKFITELEFNSGVSVYFKTYTQDVHKLQAGSCHAIFPDEELPVDLVDELMQRVSANDGLFMMVFTATRGQRLWYNTMEKIGTNQEKFKDALKFQISKYDCLKFEDGSPSHITEEKIKKEIANCSTKAQVLRRIYGRFVVDEGLIYSSFNSSKNVVTTQQFKSKNNISSGLIPSDWSIYSGVDIGSGGDNHPAAFVFIAVRPDNCYGAVFKGRRLDDVGKTTASSVLGYYRLARGKIICAGQCYDHASTDFGTHAEEVGETFDKADKDHESGEDLLNTLFKHKMLDIIVDTAEDELQKLVDELESLRYETRKTHALDDFCDATRYDCKQIPWDRTHISDEYTEEQEQKKIKPYNEIDERRKAFEDKDQDEEDLIEEIGYFNDLYEG